MKHPGLTVAANEAEAPLRLAYLTGEYPRATDTFIQREIAALRERGCRVHAFSVRRPTRREEGGSDLEAERALTSYLVPCAPTELFTAHIRLCFSHGARYLRALALAARTRPPGLRALLYQCFYFAEAGVLATRLMRQRTDHLHNHFANSSCTVAMLAAEMAGITFSFTMHGPAIFFEPHYWRIDEKIRRALFVSCISHYCRSQAMIFAPVDTWPRLHIVHCGVDPTLYRPVHHEGHGTRLLYVGRIAAVKGLPVLLRAIRTLRTQWPDLRLTVIGDGPDRAHMEDLVGAWSLSSHVAFTGYRTQEEVRQELARTDVFAMSSFAEGVPVVLMEAMASAVPVVATRVAGVSELVEEGVAGFTVPPGDEDTLAARLGELMASGDLRERMGRAGRARIENSFDIRQEAIRLHGILREALRTPRHGESTP